VPRRATKADQRDVRIELAAYPAQRLIDRLEFAEVAVPRQRPDLLRRLQGIEPRPFADLEPDRTAQRVGDQENIREDDRGIEVEAADRLERHLGGIFRREAQIEKAARLGAQFAIFRQIAAGLAHHPDRRYRLPAAGKHFKEGFWGVDLGQMRFRRSDREGVAAPDTLRIWIWPSCDYPARTIAAIARGKHQVVPALKTFSHSPPAWRSGLPGAPNAKFQTGWDRNFVFGASQAR
jgi:hypothetical protein